MRINYDGKNIYRINSSMHIEQVMWLCAMRRDNLTNQQTNLIHSIYNCYGHEMPEQSLLSKYFCIIVLHNCFQTAGILLWK